ncbi:MAG: transketolase C-terminal domain-containing protein [Lachnospiraceae bacterium]|jgi:transketolase|nr:transketolase C-terminal domain-containing protein [Lachnospiraceae bacterium]MEE3461119.1 transketolase C-terminal domain-containing protein [Lachnospiraceae bacterium]
MGARGCIGQAVYDYSTAGKDFYAVSADLGHASGFDRIISEFPEKFVNTGIAEQNLVGVASGLSADGTPVVATSWAMFTSARVADQIRNFMGFMQSNVKLVGMGSGLSESRFTYSHANPPDIAILSAIPGIRIVSPCDGIEIYDCMLEAMNSDKPYYIRLTGGSRLPVIHKEGYKYDIDHAESLMDGSDVAIVSHGVIINEALKAARSLNEQGISTAVINMHSIKPLDYEMLDRLFEMKIVVTLEEHLINGGMGSLIAQYYAEKGNGPKFKMMGINDNYPSPASYEYSVKENGLNAPSIVNQILELF